MGLDMYLGKRNHVKNYGFEKEEERVVITIKGREKDTKNIKPERISCIIEDVMYWRKANAIHKWFVDNCGDGEDNCQEIYVSRDDLKKLLSICETIIEKCPLVKGKVKNGETFDAKTKKFIPIMQEGKVLTNIEVAKELLPTQEGFFFGGTDYDEYYMEDLKRTVEVLKPIVENMEDDYGDYYYSASW